MDKEKVSIIVPMYNAEKFIGKTIESVLSQTYENWEMLIMNDVSTDNSLAVVNEFAKKDDRIMIVNTEKNMGVVKGRNHLIDLAIGKFIAFLDADDYWHSQKLEKQIQFMKEKNAGISCTEYTRVKENGEKINEVVITGLNAEYCCLFSAIIASDRGYKVTYIEDATASVNNGETYEMKDLDIVDFIGCILDWSGQVEVLYLDEFESKN